jgi:hypothetical protein
MYLPRTTKHKTQESTVKKTVTRKKLVLDRQTIRVLEAQDLDHAVGGRKDPTRGYCGTACTSDVACPT